MVWLVVITISFLLPVSFSFSILNVVQPTNGTDRNRTITVIRYNGHKWPYQFQVPNNTVAIIADRPNWPARKTPINDIKPPFPFVIVGKNDSGTLNGDHRLFNKMKQSGLWNLIDGPELQGLNSESRPKWKTPRSAIPRNKTAAEKFIPPIFRRIPSSNLETKWRLGTEASGQNNVTESGLIRIYVPEIRSESPRLTRETALGSADDLKVSNGLNEGIKTLKNGSTSTGISESTTEGNSSRSPVVQQRKVKLSRFHSNDAYEVHEDNSLSGGHNSPTEAALKPTSERSTADLKKVEVEVASSSTDRSSVNLMADGSVTLSDVQSNNSSGGQASHADLESDFQCFFLSSQEFKYRSRAEILRCVQNGIIEALDKALAADRISLLPGVSLVCQNCADKDKSLGHGRTTMNSTEWTTAVLERISKFLHSYSLNFNLMELENGFESRGHHHYRRVFPIVVTTYMIMSTFLIPLGFQFMAMLGGKALILSKLAFLWSMMGSHRRVFPEPYPPLPAEYLAQQPHWYRTSASAASRRENL